MATPEGIDAAFVLMRQPIVHLESGRVSHHELLLRMIGPAGELISPGEFAPVLRSLGHEQLLDHWVTARAVLLLVPDSSDEAGPQLEVNLSRKTIIDKGFSEQLSTALARRGVSPRALIVEAEQGGSVDASELATLARRRFSLASHFGAIDFESHGFNEVARLGSLPYDYLKIDGEFIRDLPRNPGDQGIVRRLAKIVASTGRRTVALHVEDKETVDLLLEAGVDYGQGYYFGKPQRL